MNWIFVRFIAEFVSENVVVELELERAHPHDFNFNGLSYNSCNTNTRWNRVIMSPLYLICKVLAYAIYFRRKMFLAFYDWNAVSLNFLSLKTAFVCFEMIPIISLSYIIGIFSKKKKKYPLVCLFSS